MNRDTKRRLNPKKLLLSKRTAVTPRLKEKHFIVTRLLEPVAPDGAIEAIEIEAVYTKRSQTLPWRALFDEQCWRQGWHTEGLPRRGQWKSRLAVSRRPSQADRSTSRRATRCATSPSFCNCP